MKSMNNDFCQSNAVSSAFEAVSFAFEAVSFACASRFFEGGYYYYYDNRSI